MVSGNPFLDDDDVDENDLDLSLGLQDLHASTNQNSADAVAGRFGFGLDDDTDDEDDLALPSLDDYENELLADEQSAENFSSIIEPENDLDDTASVGNHAQDNLLMSTDVDSDTEDEILFDDENDSADFDSGSELNADNIESESSQISDESHGSIIYGNFDDDDDEFIFDDDEDEDGDFNDNSFLSSTSDGVLDADGVRDIVRRLEMAGAEPEDEDTYDDEIDEDDDNFAWVDDEDSSSEAGSPFMQRGLLSGGPESDDDDEEGGWSFEDVPPDEEGFTDSRLFEDDDETLFDDDDDEDDLYDFDSPDSAEHSLNNFSDTDNNGSDDVSVADLDGNDETEGQSSDSGTPDGSVNDSEGSSDSKTGGCDTKSGDSSFIGRLKAFTSGLGERVSAVITDVKNDLRGHDGEIPESSSDDEDEGNTDSDEKGNDDNKSKKSGSRKGKGSSSNPLKSLLSTVGGFYNKLVGIFFKILTSVLGILSGIPVIGRPFKIALAATRVLEVIAKSAPALLLVAGLVTMSWMSVPSSTTTELPDEGKVEFSSFSYSNGGTALGVMKNTGEVSVEGQAQFTVYSLQPGWNPKSWFIYQAEKTCESNVVTVDIESQTEVSASCGQASGWLPRVSGTIK